MVFLHFTCVLGQCELGQELVCEDADPGPTTCSTGGSAPEPKASFFGTRHHGPPSVAAGVAMTTMAALSSASTAHATVAAMTPAPSMAPMAHHAPGSTAAHMSPPMAATLGPPFACVPAAGACVPAPIHGSLATHIIKSNDWTAPVPWMYSLQVFLLGHLLESILLLRHFIQSDSLLEQSLELDYLLEHLL